MGILKVSELTKLYGEHKGIKQLSFQLNAGEVLLFLGPNGAGKTTAIRGILGLTKTDAKEIYYMNTNVNNNPTDFLKSVGAMVSKPVFYEYMTGYEQLKMLSVFYDHVDQQRILEVLEDVDLLDAKDKKIRTYSTGMKQRLDFARAMMHNPKLLILDEPFNGMDIEQKANLKELLTYLSQEKNVAIIISSHMVGDLTNIADRVLMIHEANTIYDGPILEALKEHSLEEFYLEKIKENGKMKGGRKVWKS